MSNDKIIFFEKEITSYEENTQLLLENLRKFKSEIQDIIVETQNEIRKTSNPDKILEGIQYYFKIGKDYDYDQILEIVSEGQIRYSNSIPPGYSDYKNKEGFQKYGDLIMWKQIIDYSKNNSIPVLLIINDNKQDWWIKDKKSEIKSPRHELIKEIYSKTGNEFWMYNLKDFLWKRNLPKSAKEEIRDIHDKENSLEIQLLGNLENYLNLNFKSVKPIDDNSFKMYVTTENNDERIGFVFIDLDKHRVIEYQIMINHFNMVVPHLIEKYDLSKLTLVLHPKLKGMILPILFEEKKKKLTKSILIENFQLIISFLDKKNELNIILNSENYD